MASLSTRKQRGKSVSPTVFSKILCAVASVGGTWKDVAERINTEVDGAKMTEQSASQKRSQMIAAAVKKLQERYKKQIDDYTRTDQTDNLAKLLGQIEAVAEDKFPALSRRSRVKAGMDDLFADIEIDVESESESDSDDGDGLSIE